ADFDNVRAISPKRLIEDDSDGDEKRHDSDAKRDRPCVSAATLPGLRAHRTAGPKTMLPSGPATVVARIPSPASPPEYQVSRLGASFEAVRTAVCSPAHVRSAILCVDDPDSCKASAHTTTNNRATPGI